MTTTDALGLADEPSSGWLIVKRDLYFMPDCKGYTGIRDQAGRYSHEFAKGYQTHGCSIIHESAAPEFRAAAFDDLVIKHLIDQRDEARAALRSCPSAVREALEFYADPRRYQGPNLKPIDGDPYAKPDAAYIMDVTRDNGAIARRALALSPTPAVARGEVPAVSTGEVVAWVNGDELDNLLDDRTAVVGKRDGWRNTPLYASLPAAKAAGDEGWKDDPSADERWNAGCDFALEQLGKYLAIDLASITWDGAPETVEGDVEAVIGNILRAKFGEDWSPNASGDVRAAVIEECALVAEGFDAACNSPRMKLFVDAGLVTAIYKRDGEIGAAIRALSQAPATDAAAVARGEDDNEIQSSDGGVESRHAGNATQATGSAVPGVPPSQGDTISPKVLLAAGVATGPSEATPAPNGAGREALEAVYAELHTTAEYYASTMTGLPTGSAVSEWIENDLIPNIEETVAALASSPVVGRAEWQPIETAPKDGTRIQAGHFDIVDGSFRQFVCFWNPGWAGVADVSDEGPFWQAGGLLEHPTHWQPLPTPPSETKDAAVSRPHLCTPSEGK